MCGITGYWTHRKDPDAIATVSRMRDRLHHRGPDSHGAWAQEGVALGHRRLAILDLSEHGHQPMTRDHFVLVFNGEIFNFRELRDDLGGPDAFRGDGDTEVLLAALVRWGVEETLGRLNGQFAIALWDTRERRLTLARDRLGIKPLYYGWCDDAFVFGSELGALMEYPGVERRVNRGALASHMMHNGVWGSQSILEGILRLDPGTFVTLSTWDARPEPRTYWSAFDVAMNGARAPFSGSPEDAVDALDEVLGRAIERRMIADVGLGAFLSGGIDSSTVVSMMQQASSAPVHTFSIGFEDAAYDESSDARRVAEHLGTKHTELIVGEAQARDVIPLLPGMYDEPFADSSQIPTHLVCKLAREHVTVALSGDGGDELFGGYNRHMFAPKVWGYASRMPGAARHALSRALEVWTPAQWKMAFEVLGAMHPKFRVRVPELKIKKLAMILREDSAAGVYDALTSHWRPASQVVRGAPAPAPARELEGSDFAAHMMLLDLVTYLPDDILTKVDRASMSVSLEARVPLLDHEVVEFAWSLPTGYKIRDSEGKWPLRQVLARRVPRSLTDRPKMGFGIPLGAWLRGQLRGWAEALLEPRRLEPFFHPAPIRERWTQHLEGRADWEHHLWDVLMFQAWWEAHG